MDAVELRPKLVSFRALAFHGENRSPANTGQRWTFQLTQTIEVGLAVPTVANGILQAVVSISLLAIVSSDEPSVQKVQFQADYEAKFDYPAATVEEKIIPQFENEPYQYVLVAQAFPLAMTHFRREMQSMGFDARELPLGL